MDAEIEANLARLESLLGRKLGDVDNPLLVSVRSGAKFSMPGMMDTVLNLGLNDKSVEGLAKKTGNQRFAYESYCRFISIFANVVLGIPKDEFDKLTDVLRRKERLGHQALLSETQLKHLLKGYKALVKKKSGKDFPQDPKTQLNMARDAVFRSWNNPRAIFYRRQNNIPENLGTAVNVQAMVFGNTGPTSATGVGFTRNPATGEKEFYGEFLVNAQGEEVVAGIRTPHPISALAEQMRPIYDQLKEITDRLEKHYRDVQDFEFTIEDGKLYMLQTRSGKRTAQAALKIAVDMVKEKLITETEALLRLEAGQLEQLLHPIIDPQARIEVVAKGLPASPGAAVGQLVFNADRAVEWARDGKKVLLVRKETNPDDIHGIDIAQGTLTARGGMTSHAAVVARQMGKPCVAGCEALEIDEAGKKLSVAGKVLKEGDFLSINGSTGEVILGPVPLKAAEVGGDFATFLSWADELRRLKVRANADIPRDAAVARKYGAEGIGLCRTEHMFFAEDRLPVMQKLILAKGPKEREKYLTKLLPLQKNDFLGLFEVMNGYPVNIRLLDPPLHEFLPKREELIAQLAKMEAKGASPQSLVSKRRLLARVEELYEFNPMLGMRGCRLGITMPEITRMQVQAITEAACQAVKRGLEVKPEIMVPLVGMVAEMRSQKELVVATAEETMKRVGVRIDFSVGTMIELPRAALTADEIAAEAEFFSFGTNDLTQTTYGFSRDDAGRFIYGYMNYSKLCPRCSTYSLNREGYCSQCKKTTSQPKTDILTFEPFTTLDLRGVGELIKIGVTKGRATRADLKIGICGEHGGDPASVEFCHQVGLDYVSCSPYRVPVARLAAAQAELRSRR
jgi:pyruvate,orthophosphate dikinase